MTARSVSDLAADVPLTRAAADAADAELEAVIRRLNPELLPRLGVRALYVQAVESERDWLVTRLEAAEAQVAALTKERDDALSVAYSGLVTRLIQRAEAAEAALADTRRALADAFIVFVDTQWATAYEHLREDALTATGGGTDPRVEELRRAGFSEAFIDLAAGGGTGQEQQPPPPPEPKVSKPPGVLIPPAPFLRWPWGRKEQQP